MADADQDWRLMPEADEYVADAVSRWHLRLIDAHIVAVGRPEAARTHGKVQWAKLKRPSRLEACFYPDAMDYVLVIALDVWASLPRQTRLALVDHELSHAGGWDADAEAWTMAPHDIEEFGPVVARHGCYNADIERFLAATREVQPAQLDFAAALRPKAGSGIDTVTIESGGHGVTLHADGRTERS